MKTILVPVDLSDATLRVCDAARRLARVQHGRAILLHAVEPPPFMMNDYYAFDPGAMATVVAGEKASARKLKALGQKVAQKATGGTTLRVSIPPVATIRAKAKSSRAVFLVMGSRGHGAMFDLLVGSTAHGVLRKARCPALVGPVSPR